MDSLIGIFAGATRQADISPHKGGLDILRINQEERKRQERLREIEERAQQTVPEKQTPPANRTRNLH